MAAVRETGGTRKGHTHTHTHTYTRARACTTRTNTRAHTNTHRYVVAVREAGDKNEEASLLQRLGKMHADVGDAANAVQYVSMRQYVLQHIASHCNTLQHTAIHCNTLQHTATHCSACLLMNIPHTCAHVYSRTCSHTHARTRAHTQHAHAHTLTHIRSMRVRHYVPFLK